MRINGVGRNHHGHFHAGTQARIETHCGAQARRSGHQQIVQVTGKDVDRFIFGALAHGAHQFGFKMH